MSETLGVFKAIDAIRAELAKEGISKNRDNTLQKYKFRGIDDVYGAISAKLADHCLSILPKKVDRTVTEQESKSGGTLFYVVVKVIYEFICSADGSRYEIEMYGEAMDSGDKATNKALSAAYKYACFQVFSIPVEGSDDADAETHDVKGKKSARVFESAALRKKFCENVIQSFATANDLEGLKELVALNKIKLDALRESGEETDNMAAEEILKQYTENRIRVEQKSIINEQDERNTRILQAHAESGVKKKTPSEALLDDEIPL